MSHFPLATPKIFPSCLVFGTFDSVCVYLHLSYLKFIELLGYFYNHIWEVVIHIFLASSLLGCTHHAYVGSLCCSVTKLCLIVGIVNWIMFLQVSKWLYVDTRPRDSPGKNTGVGCHFLLHAWKWKVEVKSLSRVQLLATPWTAAYQAPPSMDFPGKSTGVGCHCLLCYVDIGLCDK